MAPETLSCALILGERESVGSDKMAEREFALPDVAMELPSCVPDDYWESGTVPSRLHAFGAEVNWSDFVTFSVDIFYHYSTFLALVQKGRNLVSFFIVTCSRYFIVKSYFLSIDERICAQPSAGCSTTLLSQLQCVVHRGTP